MSPGDDAAPRPGTEGHDASNTASGSVSCSADGDRPASASPVAELLDALGVADDEVLSVLRRRPGGGTWGGQETAGRLRRSAPDPDGEEWLGVNPMRRVEAGRGGEADVLRVPALVCDIDYRHPQVKPHGGVPDEAAARTLIADVAEAFNCPPVALTRSGHGLQVFWVVEAADSADVQAMKRRTRRFALLVERLAGLRGWKVDRLLDIARVWRAPGSWNLKADPVQVRLELAQGYALSGEQIDEALDAYDIPDIPLDHHDADPIDITSLPWANSDCGYFRAMVDGWTRDTPSGRHPWVLSQRIRLESARRYGCLTEVGYQRALEALNERYQELTPRNEHTNRLRDADRMRQWALDCAARKTEEQVAVELGNHGHRSHPVTDKGFWQSRPLFQWCWEVACITLIPPGLILANVLAEVRAAIGHELLIPPIVGAEASLNLGVIAVGGTGGGKSAARAIVERSCGLRVHTAGLGTGEGVSDQYGATVQPDGSVSFNRRSILFVVDEAEMFTQIASRKGNIMLTVLRTMATGASLRIAYRNRPINLPHNQYAASFVIAGQPEKYAPLLTDDEVVGGTPQRFLWLSSEFRDAPKPGPNRPDMLPSPGITLPQNLRGHVGFPEQVWMEVRDAQHAVVTGAASDPMRSHWMLTKLKVAALLSCADGRLSVDEKDWADADKVMRISDRTVASVKKSVAEQQGRMTRERGMAEGHRQLAASEVLRDADLGATARTIARHVHKDDKPDGCTRKCARTALASTQRHLFEDAADLAHANGWIVIEQAKGPNDVTAFLKGKMKP